MLSIAIDRVNARYHLPPGALREQPRLQRIVDAAFERALEGAIEQLGIGRDSYVCIRDVRAVVNMRLREPDSALTTGVGVAIAGAVRRLIDERSPLVVEYGSRVQALVDLASSASAGEFSRSWAWAQVGIWRADFPLGADVTADRIVRALAGEPTHAVAVLAHLARERTDRFRTLAARATPKAWAALAHAALAAASGTPVPTRGVAGVIRESIDGAREMQTLSRIARRVVMHSMIARASAAGFARDSADTRGALSALMLLEAEPSAARRADLPRLLKTIEQVVALAEVPDPAPRLETGDRQTDSLDGTRTRSASRMDDDNRHAVAGDRREELAAAIPRDEGDNQRPESREAAHIDRERPPDAAPRGDTSDASLRATGEDASPSGENAGDAPPEVRAVNRTQYGGLLYLVNLLANTGLVETIAADPWWAERGLRWVLHQVAMALVRIDPDDPAALVFAGLAPGTPPPSAQQEPPTGLEQAALDALRDVIVQALRDALGAASEDAAASDEAVVARVCARHAHIVAEPGWIEARFSVEDVSLDVRRAGLDRNPDWVPWLGIVLRFVYV
jgi:hypothetical protein